ncbi:hypothetical protein A3G63_03395 [Candidatus Kaiserbacteria bacterium RIFCSPLOWO2_12_FULL_52_8]|uniref:UDP-N-acetylglucosamine kinase n=1 Tax=Candidatus Kaiserbacteria bacterium RIFCSPHIGHO2_01_FULL_53_31 TaxID=1798481 RepID=A0A1F6CII9_9BACT|nr:MAG: hypothetical protein A2678_02645 [Candidatus Kaiserbacteria bacterium RIFCSPHIGHO2_01_FULL_53_31]OGG92919.1 MAG: hypothetical protein A3G63_03395 [Candidatus Kaiserbacteria bacterium RIFCSPLOWO2_12_FULL_52_8]
MDAPEAVLEEVGRDYEKTLVVPEVKPSPQWMLMPVGLIGSGKTTVVKPLAKHFGLIRVSTDEIREQLKQRGYTYKGAREIAHELTKKYLRLGYSIAVDGNTGSMTGLEYNKKTAEAFPHVQQLFIHINPPDKFVIDKLNKYPHTWLYKDGSHAVDNFLTNKKNFTLPNLSFVYTFDTAKENLPSQLDEAIKTIDAVLSSK